MTVAVARVLWEDGRLRLPRLWRTAAVVAAVGIALVGTMLFYAGTISGLGQQTPIAFACALVLAVVVLGPADSLLQRSLGLRVVVLAGLVSYSLFLVHDPLVRGFRDWGLTLDGRSGFAVNLLVIGGLSFVLAALTYRFVEKPALGRKRRWQAGDEAGLGSSAPAEDESRAADSPAPFRPAVAAGPIADGAVRYRLQLSPHTDTTERGPTT
jgi:peptidoglycan/LPS O-acetylase OafA/YrhL